MWPLKIPLKIKIILCLVATAGVVLLAWHYKHTLDENDRLSAQIQEEQAQLNICLDQHEIKERVSNEYQHQITDLNDRLSKYQRLFDNAVCVPVQPASGIDAATASRKFLGQNGIMASSLLDFAADCDRERIKLQGLQSYIRETQKKNPAK